MIETQKRRKRMLKLANQPFAGGYAKVGWRADEMILYAKACGHMWTKKQATEFLKINQGLFERAMINAVLDLIERALI